MAIALTIADALASGDDAAFARASDSVARARAYEYGEGVPKDLRNAIALYCEAARDGDGEAQYSLGWIYANGRGVAHDDAVAAALFRLAAGSGHEQARRALQFFTAPDGALPDCVKRDEPVASEEDDDPSSSPVDPDDDDAGGADAFADLAPWKRPIASLVSELAPGYSIRPRLALAIVAVESNFDPRATSSKDAQGLMQLMPKTAARFGVRNRYQARDNLRGGLAYLRWLLAYYRGDVRLAVAAYNAGEEAVDRYAGIPPFAETRTYVQRVLRLYARERHPYDEQVAPASPIVVPAVAHAQ